MFENSEILNKIKKAYHIKNVVVLLYDYPLRQFDLENVEDAKAHLKTENNDKVLSILYYDDLNSQLKNVIYPKQDSYLYDLLVK